MGCALVLHSRGCGGVPRVGVRLLVPHFERMRKHPNDGERSESDRHKKPFSSRHENGCVWLFGWLFSLAVDVSWGKDALASVRGRAKRAREAHWRNSCWLLVPHGQRMRKHPFEGERSEPERLNGTIRRGYKMTIDALLLRPFVERCGCDTCHVNNEPGTLHLG